MASIYVAANAVQSIAGIEFFKETARILGTIWRVLKRIGRVIAFILAMCIGGAVPLTVLVVLIKIMVAD